ncbi:MAG: NrfD/PsrC family molybdoenzyme membrane anchor subunit [Chloroflexota bacterium]
MTGYIYPNEGMIEWDLLIVIYPYITGLVAGAFVVSSLYHVFGLTRFKPVARFSLLTALAFLLITPLPLVVHLGRPERAFEMFLTPNLTSAMSAFGYIWMFYLILLLLEVWLVFRPDIIRYAAAEPEGTKKTLYSALALGVHEIPEEAAAIDRKLIKIMAFVGIPAAFLLHGYVGFIFGAVKANPWWSTPLMPIIFLLSAIVSGIALLLVLYVIVSYLRKTPPDYSCLHFLTLWLGGFLSVNVVLEGLEVFTMLYESEESWAIVSRLITEQIPVSYFGVQFAMGSVLPLFLLAITALAKMPEKTKTALGFTASAMVLVGVFAMRWNVVIGGQLISKSLRGFTTFTPPLTGLNGLVTAGVMLILPFMLLGAITYLIPPWHEEKEPKPQEQQGLRFRPSSLR